MRIDCNGESDWFVKDQRLSCRWKDLETNNMDEEWEWNNFSKEDFELLKDMEVDEVGIYIGNLDFKNPLHIKNIDINIVYGDDELNFHNDTINLDVFGEEGKKEQVENPA